MATGLRAGKRFGMAAALWRSDIDLLDDGLDEDLPAQRFATCPGSSARAPWTLCSREGRRTDLSGRAFRAQAVAVLEGSTDRD